MAVVLYFAFCLLIANNNLQALRQPVPSQEAESVYYKNQFHDGRERGRQKNSRLMRSMLSQNGGRFAAARTASRPRLSQQRTYESMALPSEAGCPLLPSLYPIIDAGRGWSNEICAKMWLAFHQCSE